MWGQQGELAEIARWRLEERRSGRSQGANRPVATGLGKQRGRAAGGVVAGLPLLLGKDHPGAGAQPADPPEIPAPTTITSLGSITFISFETTVA